MTVSSELNRKSFAGDDATTSFGTSPVVFFDTSDLVVYVVDDATGDPTTLVENTDYTVSGGAGSTGTVSLAGGSSPWGALLADTTLVIVRELPLTQETDFVNNDINDAEVQEDALDRQTMVSQQLSARIDRSVRLADSDAGAADMELPNAVDRASKVFTFDANGAPTATAAVALDIVPVSDFMVTVLDDATASDALTTLGVSTFAKTLLDDTTSNLALTTLTSTRAETGATAVTVLNKLREVISVKDFGAVGDGATDDTAAIQAAIDAAPGAILWFPEGTYKITSALSVVAAITLLGAGVGSIIAPNFATGDALTATVTGEDSGLTLRDLHFKASVTRTADYYVNLSGSYYSRIEGCLFTNGYRGVGITGDASQNIRIENCIFANHANHNINITAATGSQGSADIVLRDLWMHGVSAGSQAASGVRIISCGDVTLEHVSMIWCGSGLVVAPGTGNEAQVVMVNDSFFDTGSGYGINIAPTGTGQVQLVKVQNTWACSNSQGGIVLTGAGTTLRSEFINCTISGNTGKGVYLNQNCTSTLIMGGSMSANTGDGITVEANIEEFQIIGVNAGAGGEFAGNGAYGINVVAGTSDNYTITDNSLLGNTTAALFDGGTGKSKIVKDNIGTGCSNATVIESGNLPAAATLTISSIPAHYSYLILEVAGWSQATNTAQLVVRAGTGGVSSTAGDYIGNKITGTTVANFTTNALASMTDGATQTTAQTGSATVNIRGYASTTNKRFDYRSIGNTTEAQGFGTFILGTAIDTITVGTSAAGNFDAGTYKLIGVA